MAIYKKIIVTESFLEKNSNAYFVFGDNLIRKGTGGAAALRGHPRAVGFITKKYPNNDDVSFYKPEEYKPVFEKELEKLLLFINNNRGYIFYISQLGSGLANKYKIWENVIEPDITDKLKSYKNIIFCW